MRKFFRAFGIGLALVVVVFVVAALVIGRTEMLAFVFGPVERQTVDFNTLALRGAPNEFLACPDEICAATPHMKSPVIEDSVDELRARFLETVAARPRLTLLSSDAANDQYDVEERSPVIGFPDTMTVRLFERRDGTSTIAIYSRSHYGVEDFGVNEARVRAWLADMEAAR